MFIDFVGKLQEMKLDLESIGHSAEMANAACMGKIEERLPLAVSNGWWKKVVHNNLDEGFSEERRV